MKKNNKNDDIGNFPSEKLIRDMNKLLKWNGSTDILWSNVESKLDAGRKDWLRKFKIHLFLACVFILLFFIIMFIPQK